MDGRVVTVRMKYYPASEVLIAAMEAVRSWPWTGDAAVPVRLEYVLWAGGKTQHFAFGGVAWTQADAEALAETVDAIDVITCAVPVDPAARKVAAAKRHKAQGDVRPAPDPASLVKPSLRFLLDAAAREEAGRLGDRLEALSVGNPALAALAASLREDFPIMARTDEALGGQLREVLRQAGTLPRQSRDAFDALAMRRVAWAIRDGRPHDLTPTFVAGKKKMGLLDRALMEIGNLRRWMERESAKAAASSEQADDCPF